MATSLTIPDNQRPQFKRILGLDEKEFEHFVYALENAPASADFETFVKSVETRIEPAISDADRLIGTVVSFYSIPSLYEVSIEEVAQELSAAYHKVADLDEAQQTTLQARLTRLLRFEDTIGLTRKAVDVLLSNPCTYVNAQAVTDIRPVFSQDKLDTPAGVVFVHTINIGYAESGEGKCFFVTLNTKDIDLLQAVLERAKEKEASLRKKMATSGLTILEV